MLSAYRMQDWDKARVFLAECRHNPFNLWAIYDIYSERIETYVAHPPGSGWDGTFNATTK
jgi:hypothetical protein